MSEVKRYTLPEVPHLVHGRTNGSLTPLTLFWTAAGLELNVRGSELWYSFMVNGEFFSRRMAQKGTERVCVFRGMDPEKVKNVRIFKDTQAMNADPESVLQINAIETDGEFLPVPERNLKIEFIGDSITSGEGDIGAKAETDWISMFFSAENNYAHGVPCFKRRYPCLIAEWLGRVLWLEQRPKQCHSAHLRAALRPFERRKKHCPRRERAV